MTPEKWADIKGHIKDNFVVADEGSEHINEEGGVDIEYLEFKGPLGKMRLEYITKPVVTGKKTTYSKRIGSDTSVEYAYSPDELAHKLQVYRWDEDQEDWLEMEAEKLNL